MRLARAWPWALNVLVAGFVGGAVLAPLLAAMGFSNSANAIYSVYHLTCHQWAFRSFFVFGAQAVYSPEQLAAQSVDPYTFDGDSSLGWKMAFCERDLAIYLAVLAMGILFARKRSGAGLSLKMYALLVLPMALDGVTQLFGWRESTWQLRVLTGLLFGAASVAFLYPRFDAAFGIDAYPPEHQWAAPPPRG
jgi:uncharacterized membrane protein